MNIDKINQEIIKREEKKIREEAQKKINKIHSIQKPLFFLYFFFIK